MFHPTDVYQLTFRLLIITMKLCLILLRIIVHWHLIYHAGISVEMNYAPTGSGSQTEKARMSLMGYFGYSATSRYERKEMYSNSVWLSKIAESLDSKLPIIYSGRKVDADAGHAWICDGYESLTDTTAYLHFNWGWGINGGNGWFLSTTMNGYTVGETAIFGLTPKVDLPTCARYLNCYLWFVLQ